MEAIDLYLTGNAQGSWVFISLLTGHRIHRYQWNVVPMTNTITNRVEALALAEGQPLVAENFKYEWYPGDELVINAGVVEEEAPPPNYQNMAPVEMVQDNRMEAAINAEEEASLPAVVNNHTIVDTDTNTYDGGDF